MTSKSCRVSRPARAPSAIASAAAAMCTPARSWFTIFTLLPAPGPPLIVNSLPGGVAVMPLSTPAARLHPSAVPEDIMVRAPSAARATPPETGASTNSRSFPMLTRRSEMATAALPGTVEQRTTTAPEGKASAAPLENSTSCACSAFTTIRTRTLVPVAASEMLEAGFPPAATKRSRDGCHTSKPFTAKPARTRLAAMPEPIAPSPTNPTEEPAIVLPENSQGH
mmetsp:Transcript_10481/g.29814  ORF Transcript_10481/g.29814 Transcript_10481/m.29814 type:complete len:224 (+) Transcript_10481:2693-3364(+)